MEIKDAAGQDLPAILNLQKECFLEEAAIYNDYKIPPVIQSLSSLQNDFVNQTFLKATIEGKIVGSVRAYQQKETCYIGRLIVDKNFRDQGIGRMLMAAIEERFKNAGRFELFTGFKSLKNLSLYNKLGYKEFKREEVDGEERLVFMEKIK